MMAMIDFQRVWNWYSRESVLKAIVEAAKNREVVAVYRDGIFGKRPDVIQYPQDVLQSVAKGAISFHGSLERWQQPMKLDVGLSKPQLDAMRIGWDVLFDIDVDDFEIAKLTVRQLIEAFKDHGVVSYGIKFSGGSSFHVAIPFEALPEKINAQPTASQYPELLQKIIEYVKWYVKDQLKEEISALGSPEEISRRVGKPLKEIVEKGEISPFKIISIDIFGSRHLFRLPYSLHEKTLRVSLPIKPEDLEKFEVEQALPEKVKVEEKFLVQKSSLHDAEPLVIEALDWSSRHLVETKEEIPKILVKKKIKAIPEDYFPPCIKNILQGLSDGRKRSLFILTNFLKNMGWSLDKIENKINEWNSKNVPPLRNSYLRTQLRWHFRQERNLLPPNCDNENFYKDIGVCKPDEFCTDMGEKIVIKNPVNYPFKRLKKRKRKRT
jgi:DNA primase large subunit